MGRSKLPAAYREGAVGASPHEAEAEGRPGAAVLNSSRNGRELPLQSKSAAQAELGWYRVYFAPREISRGVFAWRKNMKELPKIYDPTQVEGRIYD